VLVCRVQLDHLEYLDQLALLACLELVVNLVQTELWVNLVLLDLQEQQVARDLPDLMVLLVVLVPKVQLEDREQVGHQGHGDFQEQLA
jgi:hypothetical protein